MPESIKEQIEDRIIEFENNEIAVAILTTELDGGPEIVILYSDGEILFFENVDNSFYAIQEHEERDLLLEILYNYMSDEFENERFIYDLHEFFDKPFLYHEQYLNHLKTKRN